MKNVFGLIFDLRFVPTSSWIQKYLNKLVSWILPSIYIIQCGNDIFTLKEFQKSLDNPLKIDFSREVWNQLKQVRNVPNLIFPIKICHESDVIWNVFADSKNLRWKSERLSFFSVSFLSQPFTNHRTAAEGGEHSFNSSLPLSPFSQAFRH